MNYKTTLFGALAYTLVTFPLACYLARSFIQRKICNVRLL